MVCQLDDSDLDFKRCGMISDQTANVQFDNYDKIVYASFGFI